MAWIKLIFPIKHLPKSRTFSVPFRSFHKWISLKAWIFGLSCKANGTKSNTIDAQYFWFFFFSFLLKWRPREERESWSECIDWRCSWTPITANEFISMNYKENAKKCLAQLILYIRAISRENVLHFVIIVCGKNCVCVSWERRQLNGVTSLAAVASTIRYVIM